MVKIQSVLLNLNEVFHKCRQNESCKANMDDAQEENEEKVNHWLTQIKKYVPKKSGKSFAMQMSMLEKSLSQSKETKEVEAKAMKIAKENQGLNQVSSVTVAENSLEQ